MTSGHADIDPTLLYGLPDESGVLVTEPVMRLTGRVLSTKRLRAGDAVSYGYTYRASADTTVALVTGGYAQGIVRALGNQGLVDIDGVARPIIGRVAMDVCVVDLAGSDVEAGAEATYFGGRGPAADGTRPMERGHRDGGGRARHGGRCTRGSGVGGMSRPELRVSSSVFRTNIEAVRTRIAPSALMLVLKDDAYGHGLAWAVETARPGRRRAVRQLRHRRWTERSTHRPVGGCADLRMGDIDGC